MVKDFAQIVAKLITTQGGRPLAGVDVGGQFRPGALEADEAVMSLNAAFLLAMAGDHGAMDHLRATADDPDLGDVARFLMGGMAEIAAELKACADSGMPLARDLADCRAALQNQTEPGPKALEALWKVFFPEGLAALGDRAGAVGKLRQARRIKLTMLNPEPIADPLGQVLFSSNILLGPPLLGADLSGLAQDNAFKLRLTEAAAEPQLYWYDHPIPVGIAPEGNEIVHGLKGLAQAAAFERQRHPQWGDAPLKCVLSVSVTHAGLRDLAHQYLNQELRQAQGLDGLEVYLFTEADTDRLKQEVIFPAVARYFPETGVDHLDDVLGVDGEYGRHYSFLKAVSAWWSVMIDTGVKGTFKIDLDQVFPQRELVSQTGQSALEHLCTPLWGATGRDSGGEEVDLGLIAGALVNQKDIGRGLFTPDVPWPGGRPSGDQCVFYSTLPQALSTEAEMMTRYDGGAFDGKGSCIQRIHVTGGTNGILVDALRRHRPFTPTFIGRAEDQAYIMSVLHGQGPSLRYVHKPGLIMRHDKEALTPTTIKAAKVGKMIGDYVRILWFSQYGRSLPWPLEGVKAAIDPFTGCFVSRLPQTVVHLRLALKAAAMHAAGDTAQAAELLRMGAERLAKVIALLRSDPDLLRGKYQRERSAWGLFYDVLERLERGLAQGNAFAKEMAARSRALAAACRV